MIDRSQFIGASEVSALLNRHPFLTPKSLWERKTKEAEEKAPGEAAIYGLCIEPGLIKMFTEYKCPCTLVDTQIHCRRDRAGATIDAIVADGEYKRRKFREAVLEIKTYGRQGTLPYHDEYGRGGSAEIPVHVYDQVQLQLYCGDFDDDVEAFVYADGPGSLPKVYRIPPNRSHQYMLADVIERFWHSFVEADIQPEEHQSILKADF